MRENQWKTKAQLAEEHDVTTRTINNWVNTGKVQRKEIEGKPQFRVKPRVESYYFASQDPSYASKPGPTPFTPEMNTSLNETLIFTLESKIFTLENRVETLDGERLEYIQRLAELESRQRYMHNLLDAYALQRQRTFWAWLVSSFKRLFALV